MKVLPARTRAARAPEQARALPLQGAALDDGAYGRDPAAGCENQDGVGAVQLLDGEALTGGGGVGGLHTPLGRTARRRARLHGEFGAHQQRNTPRGVRHRARARPLSASSPPPPNRRGRGRTLPCTGDASTAAPGGSATSFSAVSPAALIRNSRTPFCCGVVPRLRVGRTPALVHWPTPPPHSWDPTPAPQGCRPAPGPQYCAHPGCWGPAGTRWRRSPAWSPRPAHEGRVGTGSGPGTAGCSSFPPQVRRASRRWPPAAIPPVSRGQVCSSPVKGKRDPRRLIGSQMDRRTLIWMYWPPLV